VSIPAVRPAHGRGAKRKVGAPNQPSLRSGTCRGSPAEASVAEGNRATKDKSRMGAEFRPASEPQAGWRITAAYASKRAGLAILRWRAPSLTGRASE
jgi:hypothetical protein